MVIRSFIVFSSDDDVHLSLRRSRQDRRRPTIDPTEQLRTLPQRSQTIPVREALTLLLWLPERLLPLFGSHRSRVAAATAWARGCWRPQPWSRPCAWRGNVPDRDGRRDPWWLRWTSSASTSMRCHQPSG